MVQIGGKVPLTQELAPRSQVYVATPLDTSNSFLVDFNGAADPYNPKNWPLAKKISMTLLYGCTTMGTTWSSAIYSTGIKGISQEFNIGEDIGALGTSLFLIGLGTGPLLWAPLSELYGRKMPTLIPYFVASCFTFGTAAAKDTQTVMITRFMAGFFGSAPMCTTAGALADMFPIHQRAIALTGYAMAVIGGPVFGPIAGGAMMHNGLSWRWTQYVTGIFTAAMVFLDVLFIKETYSPVLLTKKARRQRLQTGQWAYHAKHEEWDASFKEMASKYLVRPLQLLRTPICFFGALHASFVYAIVYLNLGSFPIIFQGARGWNQLVGTLPFLALILGAFIGSGINILSGRWYARRVKINNGHGTPEDRLPPMMIGAILIMCGLFLIGNTADPEAHPWIAPVIAAVLMGIGFFTMFQSVLNYQIDTFPKYAASAVAANTFMRSTVAGVFPPLVARMYEALGIRWASNLLGFISLAMVPIPWLFYFLGPRVRARSRWSQ